MPMQTLFSLVLVVCSESLVAVTMILGWFYFHLLDHIRLVFFISFLFYSGASGNRLPSQANRFVVPLTCVVAVVTYKDGKLSLSWANKPQ